jgi:type I restriction enzyme S subunit
MTVPKLNQEKMRSIPIPIPPLSEQEEIVSILDDAFESIERAKSNAEQNLKNAKELFESYLQDIFEDLFYKSSTQKIEDLATVTGGYSFNSETFIEKGKYQVLRMGNIRNGLIRESESPVYIDELDEKITKKALLQINDVIITQTGTKNKRDYGFTVIIEKFNYLLNQRIASIRFSNKILPKYFLYFSWTNLFRDQYFENETGTVGQGNVGIGAITSAKVPTITNKEQELLINAIETLLDKTKKLESIYQQKLNDLEELKKSILQKAFNGELKTSKISA